MKFGKYDINDKLDWSKWSWDQFQGFYKNNLKGVKESPEKIAKALGVKLPEKKEKEKPEKA